MDANARRERFVQTLSDFLASDRCTLTVSSNGRCGKTSALHNAIATVDKDVLLLSSDKRGSAAVAQQVAHAAKRIVNPSLVCAKDCTVWIGARRVDIVTPGSSAIQMSRERTEHTLLIADQVSSLKQYDALLARIQSEDLTFHKLVLVVSFETTRLAPPLCALDQRIDVY